MTAVDAWGGFFNGQIPLSAMVAVDNYVPIQAGPSVQIGSNLLEPETARQLKLWQAAYKTRFGINLNCSECYRPYARQEALWAYYQTNGSPVAAMPGTSNHGFGKAVDFGSPVSIFGTTQHDWMVSTATAYGFNFDVSSEAWHASYYGTPTITTGPTEASTGTTTPIGDDDLPTPADVWNTPNASIDKNAPVLYLKDVFVHARQAAGYSETVFWNTPNKVMDGNAPSLVLKDVFVHARQAAGVVAQVTALQADVTALKTQLTAIQTAISKLK